MEYGKSVYTSKDTFVYLHRDMRIIARETAVVAILSPFYHGHGKRKDFTQEDDVTACHVHMVLGWMLYTGHFRNRSWEEKKKKIQQFG